MSGSIESNPLLLHDDCCERICDAQPLGSKLGSLDWRGKPSVLRSRPLGGKITMFFTTGSMCLMSAGSFGIHYNLVSFFQNVFKEGSGRAANDTNIFIGTNLLAAFLGAFVADSFLGSIWTCTLFIGIATTGMVLMTIFTYAFLSADVNALNGTMRGSFYFFIYIVAMGCGAYVPSLQSLGADQFDSEIDKATFFTWFLVLTHAGQIVADTAGVYVISSKGWVIGFGMLTIFGTAGFIVFVSSIPLYRQFKHRGNPYIRVLRVLVAAARKCRVKLSPNSDDMYEEVQDDGGSKQIRKHTAGLRWLDKAATVIPCDNRDDGIRNVWKLSTVTEVEEVKALLRLIPIWASSIFFNTIYSQSSTLLVEEGALMDLTITGGLVMEPATMNMFSILVGIFVGPIYNVAVVPITRFITGLPWGLSSLQRMGVGLAVSAIAITLAGALEAFRLHCSKQGAPLISIFWQIPVYLMLGLALFFVVTGSSEFFYTNAPPSLRSFGTSLSLTCLGLGSYLSTLLMWIVTLVTTQDGAAGWIPPDLNDGHLDYFLWLLGGLAFLNLFFFIWRSRIFMQHQSSSRF